MRFRVKDTHRFHAGKIGILDFVGEGPSDGVLVLIVEQFGPNKTCICVDINDVELLE